MLHAKESVCFVCKMQKKEYNSSKFIPWRHHNADFLLRYLQAN